MRDRDDAGVALRHGLIGEVVYGALVPSERAALHRELGAALEATGAPVAELAHQWHRAGEQAAALAASVEAGRAAARVYAFAEALGHLERALALWPQVRPDRADRVELLSLAAQAARFAGDRERAVALGREALEQQTSWPTRCAPRGCTSGSASTSRGTTRRRSSATRPRWRTCRTRRRRSAPGCSPPRATR